MAAMEEPSVPGSGFSSVKTVAGLSAALQEITQVSPLLVRHLLWSKLSYSISLKQTKKYNKNAF